jgi:hypothetical protein
MMDSFYRDNVPGGRIESPAGNSDLQVAGMSTRHANDDPLARRANRAAVSKKVAREAT